MSDETPQRPNDDPGGEPSGFEKFMKVMKVVAYLFVGVIVLTALLFGTCLLMLRR